MLLFLFFKGIVCPKMNNVNIYSLSCCSVWRSSEKHKKGESFFKNTMANSFLIFHVKSFEAIQYLCVRNRSKLFIALYIGMHNKSTTFQLSNYVIVLDCFYYHINQCWICICWYWIFNCPCIFSLLDYLFCHLTLKVNLTNR